MKVKKSPRSFVVHEHDDWVFTVLRDMCLPPNLVTTSAHYLSDVKKKKKEKKSPSPTPSFYRWKSQGSEVKGLASSLRFSFHYSRPANSSLLFIETVLLGHSQPICLWLLYGCFHTTRAEWSSCDRAQTAYKPKILSLVLYSSSPILALKQSMSQKYE